MSQKSSGIIGALIAFGIGVVVGLLFAPKSGKETRADIADVSKRVGQKLEKQLRRLRTELSDHYALVQARVNELSGKARAEAETYARYAAAAVEKASQTIRAFHDGSSTDADLQEAVTSAQDAVEHLRKFAAK